MDGITFGPLNNRPNTKPKISVMTTIVTINRRVFLSCNPVFVKVKIEKNNISKAKRNKLGLFLNLISLASSKTIRIEVDKITKMKIKPPKYSDNPYTSISIKDVLNLGPRSFIIIH
jgi:hypothetical protein